MPIVIPGTRDIGELGHTGDHNLVSAALTELAFNRIRVVEAIGSPVNVGGSPVAANVATGVVFDSGAAYQLAEGDLFLVQPSATAIGAVWVRGTATNTLAERQPESRDIYLISNDTGQTGGTGGDTYSLAGVTLIVGAQSGPTAPFTQLGPQLRGATGPSAYDVAVAEGFVGTEVEWLASLAGAEGPTGVKGDPGVTNITVDANWSPGDPVPAGTPVGTRILRRKP